MSTSGLLNLKSGDALIADISDITATADEINRAADSSGRIVNATAATLTVTAATHGSRIVTLNRAAGIAVTLPAASGTGEEYRFFIGTTVTSNTTTIKAANASDTMSGIALIDEAGGATAGVWPTAADTDTITFDGSTTGGILGDFVELIDVAANKWYVRLVGSTTGTEATPFSATVS